MYAQKALLCMVFLIFCYVNEVSTAQDVNKGTQTSIWIPQAIQRTFPRMGWSSLNLHHTIPEAYASPELSCHREGFYSNPSDCTKFFRCINAYGNNNYSALTFTCAPGTYFSEELVSCISGSCSRGGVSKLGVSTVEVSTSGLPTDSNNILEANSPITTHQIPKCVSEGRVVDPDDCGQYYDCVQGRSGDLIETRQTCSGHAFDATLNKCVPLQKAKTCIPKPTNGLRNVNENDSKFQNLCKDHENKFFCLDCKTLVMCIGGKAQIIPCKYGDVCYKDETVFSGGVCYPDTPFNCTCNNENAFQPDIYDKSKFLSCGTQGAEPVIQSCPAGLEFNEEFSSCGAPVNTTCSESGTFAVKSDCTKYHTCTYTTNGLFFQSVFTCDNKTMYNEVTGKCEDPCNWYNGIFQCEQEGRFSNLGDCTKFFECLKDPSNENKFIKIEHECWEGYEWLPLVNRYHCVAKGTTKEICIPKKPNTCEVPRKWCNSTIAVPAEFEQLTNGRLVRRTRSSDSRSNYNEAMEFCNRYNAQPFIARTAMEFQVYKEARASLGYSGFMWLPVSDVREEGTLRWFNDELVSSNISILVWCRGEKLSSNSGNADYILYGTCDTISMHFSNDRSDGFPPVCEIM